MKHIDTAALSRDPNQRFQFLKDFVGFGDDDWSAMEESLAILGPKLPGLLDAIYDHLLSYDDVRRVFLGPRGEVDPQYIEIRKEHLTEWVLRTTDRRSSSFAEYVMTVGRRHTGVDGDPGRVVPPRYMVALVSFVQTALTSTLFEALRDRPDDLRRMVLAWNKMLIIQLEMFLKALVPQWPKWDEP